MNDLQVFDYQDSRVRTYTDENGEVWLVAKDVCDILGIVNARDAVSELDDDEKHGVAITDTIGREQITNVISEAGLYKLSFKSRKEGAKKFTRWVTHEVLPQIRKTGYYSEKKDNAVVPAQPDNGGKKKPLPAHSGTIKAAEKIISKMFRCKKESDFQEVLLLDKIFSETFDRSLIVTAGYRLVKTITYITLHFDGCGYPGNEEIDYKWCKEEEIDGVLTDEPCIEVKKYEDKYYKSSFVF